VEEITGVKKKLLKHHALLTTPWDVSLGGGKNEEGTDR